MRAPRLLLRLMGKAFALVTLLVSMTAGVAMADTIYVDTGGNDAWDGSSATFQGGTTGPVRTIGQALTLADDDDIISIEAGTYDEGLLAVTDDVIFEARQTGSFTRVLVVDGLNIQADVIVRANSIGGFADGVFRVGESNLASALILTSGSLDVQGATADGRLRIPDGGTVTRTEGSVSGDIVFQGDLNVVYNGATSITAGAELPADLGNDGSLNVQFTAARTLTLTQAVTFGDELDINANSTVVGNLVSNDEGDIDIDGELTGILTIQEGNGPTTLDVAGEIDGTTLIETPNNEIVTIMGGGDIGLLDVNNGDVTFAASMTTNGVDIANDDDISVLLGGNTLTVLDGDFLRAGGEFTQAGGTLAFTGTASNNTLTPGPNFQIGTLTVNKSGRTLTITDDVDVMSAGPALTIAASTTLDIGGDNINVRDDGDVDVDGTFLNLPDGGIVFFEGGATISGDGTYGNIFVSTTGGADIIVPAGQDVHFAGILSLSNGGIDATGGEIGPTGDDAEIIVNMAAAVQPQITGPFNVTTPSTYDLTYTGALPGARTVGSEFDADWVVNVTFNTSGNILTLTGTDGDSIEGNFTMGTGALVALPVASLSVEGVLTVGDNALLSGGNAADTFALTTNDLSHSVVGEVTAASILTVDATGVTITGSTVDANAEAELANLTLAEDATATLTNIQAINGAVVVGIVAADEAALTLGMAREMTIAGALTLQGAGFTMTSDVTVNGAVAVNSGTFDFGSNDLTAADAFEGDDDVTYANGGTLILTGAGNENFGTDGVAIPNVTLGAAATRTLSSDTEISNSFSESGDASLTFGAGDLLTLGGTVTSDGDGAPAFITGAGEVVFNTTTFTMSGNPLINVTMGVTVDEGATLTLASNNNTQRTLSLDGGDLTVDGTIALGGQVLAVIDAHNVVSAGGSVTGSGTLTVAGGNIEPSGNTFSISNLTTNAAEVDLGATSNGTLLITGTLRLETNLDETDGNDIVSFADGATIVRAGGILVDAPTFVGDINLTYEVASTTLLEVSTDGQNINNFTVNAPVDVDDDITISGTLSVSDDLDTNANDVITLAGGATLLLQDGFNIAGADIETTAFNLTVDTTGPNNLNADILDFVDEDEITTLTVSLNGGAGVGILTVNDPTTANNVVLDSGELELDANFSITGNLTFDGGTIDNDPLDARVDLIFSGGAAQTVALDGDYVVDNIDVTIDKSGNSVVTLTGDAGDELDFRTNGEIIYLNGGIVQTDMNAAVFLYQDNLTQGFVRNIDAANDEESHISGNVRKRLLQGDPFTGGRSARFEFPTGPAATAETPDYRPFVLTFRDQIVTQTDITVNHQNQNPQGELGLPIASGDVLIGNYPDYFWLVEASTSLGQAQTFDVELTATDIGIPFTDDDDLRIIRRFDGDATTNEWNVQGSASNYDNFVSVDEDEDTTAVVRVLNSSGGLVPQGARFTLGLPTRPPLFTSADPGTLTVDEGQGVTFDFDADPQDLGETITFSLGENAPAFVTIDAQTGVLTAEPGFEDAGTYTFDVIASDGTATTTLAVTLIVNDVLEITPAQEDVTINDGETLTIDFDVSNPNPADPVTFGLGEEVENASIDATTGVFTFTPDFDQAGMVFDFVVFAKNESDSAGVAFSVTVEADVLYGDANLSGDVTPLDASVVLQHAAGEITLTGKAATQADVSGTAGVTAFDAALILQFLTPDPDGEGNILDCFPADPTCEVAAKMGMVAFGDPQWGDVTVDAVTNTITLPIALDGNVDNVYAINFTADVDVELVNFKQVTGMLPDDWMVKSFFDKKAGKLTIAMAGATPLSDAGVIAKATFEQLDSESKPVFRAQGFVNENASVEFGEIKAEQLPTEFALGDNYPNPFNPSTAITYALPQKAQVTLEIYDVAGRLVQTLVNQEREAGRYTIQWNGQNAAGSQVASGLYVYRIKAGSFVEAKTMMLVK